MDYAFQWYQNISQSNLLCQSHSPVNRKDCVNFKHLSGTCQIHVIYEDCVTKTSYAVMSIMWNGSWEIVGESS